MSNFDNCSEQQVIRRKKLFKLKSLGIDPYPSKEYKISHLIGTIHFIEKKKIRIAGRLIRLRILGKASFGEIQDHTGRIQSYFKNFSYSYSSRKDKEQPNFYNIFFKQRLIDIGDIIGVEGFLFKTKMNEITIYVKQLTLLSKSLRPLPQVKVDNKNKKIYDAFSNIEQRYRMRYVDLIVNDHVKNIFLIRTLIFKEIRKFLDKKGYLEVETPILQSIPGGAIARPFKTYHNTLGIPLYLRIANELYLKRLIIGGFHGVYEFSKNFRNEGMDRMHNPEFTVLELYVAYKDYYWMMNFTEELMKYIYEKILETNEIYNFKKDFVKLQSSFPRIPIIESIQQHTGFNIQNMNTNELIEVCKQLNIEVKQEMSKAKLIENIFAEKCETNYKDPTFITDYPIEMSPLSKTHRNNKNLSERFELIINGKEIANAYSELNDPIDQLNRFREQIQLSLSVSDKEKEDESMFLDQDFIRSLEFGMPPTSGIGIGIDRLVMLMTKQNSIQEVLLFPQMRPETKK
ncbi:lysine--tRNA ligase [Blattabacterium cuenoti]|uniref:lysine--tRNA ligase n=1 Tax=Blattabacterium cuenoti TaxID=1653831 RepID=UPI00163CEB00|nr:lysine--tRNA ligase [Blattabacterium cuenoti]